MKLVRNKKLMKGVAIFMALTILTEVVAPMQAFALTGGPKAPEFASFEPVATTDMVNVFSGDFTYNLPVLDIPGPDGGGYSMSLSYQSGTSSEEEASWVGHGWTLNPGAISRDARGFPDEYNGSEVTYYNKTRPNWSTSASEDIGLEMFSQDGSQTIGINASTSLRFNNYQGYLRSYGLGVSLLGLASLNVNFDANGPTFSANINPVAILGKFTKKKDDSKNKQKDGQGTNENKESNKKSQMFGKKQVKQQIQSKISGALSQLGSTHGLFSFSEAVTNTSLTEYTGKAFNWSGSGQVNAYPPIGVQGGFAGNFNMQYNTAERTMPAYGYMNNPGSFGNKMSDYYVEKGSAFDKRDYFIGIPFSNADNFAVMGEGLGGGFRFYHDEVGHFYPNEVESKTKIGQMGVEFMLGQNIGIGLDFGIGEQKLSVRDWENGNKNNIYAYGSGPSGGRFRFANDMGGKVEYTNTSEMLKANIGAGSKVPGFKTCDINIDGSTVTPNITGNSSFINYTTNPSGIDKISVVNEDGAKYKYGIPVYTRNEANLQFGLSGHRITDNYLAFQPISLAADHKVANLAAHDVIMGEVKPTQYASTFLLSSITTSDYIDRDGNGEANDADFGGWTNFHYKQKYGSQSGAWYRYRTPYAGLFYNKNQISDRKDDVGSLTTGEKEIYYLKAIETKTHVAFFVTNKSTAADFAQYLGGATPAYLNGSGTPRRDGRSAMPANGTDPNSDTESPAKGLEMEYLEKIVLVCKARPEKPVKTTLFEYAKSGDALVQNLPNNTEGNYPFNRLSERSGKLTLRKVWFEYEGIVNSHISPYVFKYEYMDVSEFSSGIPKIQPIPNGPQFLNTRYPDFNAMSQKVTKESQNPNYNPHQLDAWGFLQYKGKEQHEKVRTWLYQGPIYNAGDDKDFDPAAWQLKQVQLPSGGAILVDYEQKDYRFVQDRQAMALASIKKYEGEDFDTGESSLIIDPMDMGLDYEDPDYLIKLADLRQVIEDYYENDKTKVYFKFLYALIGETATLDDCKSEYISGYAKFKKVEITAQTFPVRGAKGNLLNGQKPMLRIVLQGDKTGTGDEQRTNIPRQACYELVANQRVGKMEGDCESDMDRKYDAKIKDLAYGNNSNLEKAIKSDVVIDASKDMQEKINNPVYKIPSKSSVCKTIRENLSYLKLPMNVAKRGGGVRVKGIYMYDPGIESGDGAIYGSQYFYQTEDGLSSGVATNEPGGMREENPLITFLPKKGQSWYSRITAGEDKEQTEGPIGESILPPPSVGHSRVVVRNIHTGKTGNGYTVNEYFTCKDYPYDKMYSYNTAYSGTQRKFDDGIEGKAVDFTPLSDGKVTDKMLLPAGLINYTTNKVWLAQGFRFIINQMHGQTKKVATYGGEYDTEHPEKSYLTSLQEYTYYEPGEKVRMLKPNGQFEWDIPGKEEDLTMEIKSLKDQTTNLSIEVDISITICVTPPVFVSLFPTFDYNETLISTHAVSKVIRYPTLVKSILNYQDGIYNLTENLAYNEHTGKPVLTRTRDGYDNVKINSSTTLDGSMYSFTIPASWKYQAMGRKSDNPAYTNQLSATTATFMTYGANANPIDDVTKTWTLPSQNLVSVSINTYGNSGNTANITQAQWILDKPAGVPELDNIWRGYASYVYKNDISSANTATGRTYNSGTFSIQQPFDWNRDLNGLAQTDPKWIRTNAITKYNVHGSGLEDVNVLNIFSAVKFGYNDVLPVMTAANADVSSIYFEDFENQSTATSGIAHTGAKSLQMSGSGYQIPTVAATSLLKKKGGFLRIWVKSATGASLTPVETNTQGLQLTVNGSKQITFEKIAKTGEWSLYEAKVSADYLSSVSNLDMVITYSSLVANEQLFLDDVRFQPEETNATCYVYDVGTLRLLAQFDDQHFGMLYQYDEEAKLIRKLIETERGVKMIQENQQNSPRLYKRPVQFQ